MGDTDKVHFSAEDLEKARAMLHKYLLIGITYLDHEGKFIEQQQRHGRITAVDPNGIRVLLEGAHSGEIFDIPPDLRSFEELSPGTYRERSTGEEIIDPDYMTTWEITKPPPDWKAEEADESTDE